MFGCVFLQGVLAVRVRDEGDCYRKLRNKGDEAVQSDWDTLWRKIGKELSRRFSGSYLATEPPQVQILDDENLLDWQDRKTENLLIYVGRVRNNLFHGGKQAWDIDRDKRLIHGALDVLEASLDIEPNLQAAYRR